MLSRSRPRSTPALVALAALGAALAACASTPPPSAPAPPAPTGTLRVLNPTGDSYALSAAGHAVGTVAPGARLVVQAIPAGQVAVLARNDRLALTQRQLVALRPGGEATVTLVPQLARLRVVNGRAAPVELLVDGVSVGWVAPEAETVLSAVPAGKRTLVAQSGAGPGAVRVERFLPEGEETRWAVPALGSASGSAAAEAPRPPSGQGLIWMRNTSERDVRVLLGSEEVAFVAAGATAEIVVAPGTHTLRVQHEELDAASEHTVTLSPNQTAEWTYHGR